MRFVSCLLIAFVSSNAWAAKKPPAPETAFYRQFTQRLRTEGEFKVPMPSGSMHFDYKFEFGDPIYPQPLSSDTIYDSSRPDGTSIIRLFWDRIWLKDGSYVTIEGEQIPLTCVFISGQDNRYAGAPISPLFPEFIIKVYLVANDIGCQGPIRPGWPKTGGKKENWDTYIHYEIRDPTIMLPMDTLLRYRWNEFPAILVR